MEEINRKKKNILVFLIKMKMIKVQQKEFLQMLIKMRISILIKKDFKNQNLLKVSKNKNNKISKFMILKNQIIDLFYKNKV